MSDDKIVRRRWLTGLLLAAIVLCQLGLCAMLCCAACCGGEEEVRSNEAFAKEVESGPGSCKRLARRRTSEPIETGARLADRNSE